MKIIQIINPTMNQYSFKFFEQYLLFNEMFLSELCMYCQLVTRIKLNKSIKYLRIYSIPLLIIYCRYGDRKYDK